MRLPPSAHHLVCFCVRFSKKKSSFNKDHFKIDFYLLSMPLNEKPIIFGMKWFRRLWKASNVDV